jgi:hypothetical protein
MVAITIGGAAVATTTEMILSQQELAKEERLAEEINSVVNGVDKRLNNDKYDLSFWSDFSSGNYTFNNTNQVSEFLGRALIGKSAPNCGQINGWVPQKDDAVDEAYKDKYQLIACNLWSAKLPFDLNVKSKINHSSGLVDSFELEFFFSEEKAFEDNYLHLKSIANKSERMEKDYLSGVTEYNFVNLTSGAELDPADCIQEKDNCSLKVTFLGSDTEQDYLHVNGNNNMIGSKIKFQEDLTSTAMNTCYRYTNDSGSWNRVDDVYCGIGFGFEDPTDPTAGVLNYVEVNVDSISTERIFLDKACNFKDTSGNNRSIPCGVYNENRNVSGTMKDIVVAAYDEVLAESLLSNVIDTKKVFADETMISKELNVSGTTKLEGNLTATGTASFDDKVTISGSPTAINLVVETAAEMKDVTIDGALTVNGNTTFNKNVDVFGDLDVNGVLSTDKIAFNSSITASKIGTACSVDGTLNYYKSGSDSGLAICSGGKWNLINMQKNKIVAFDGSCPTGFKKFNKADGRVLLGAGTLRDTATGQNLTYTTGGIGGSAYHVLTEAEMPAHTHGVQDAYWSEHWGDFGPRNQRGANGGQDNDNNLYTRNVNTEYSGGNAAHENRMPYYVVNWCIYEG